MFPNGQGKRTTLKRVRSNSVFAVLLWGLNLSLILVGSPVELIVFVGVLGSVLALRDWRAVRLLAKEKIYPVHPNLDVQALIDGDIDISEYRRRKESVSSAISSDTHSSS